MRIIRRCQRVNFHFQGLHFLRRGAALLYALLSFFVLGGSRWVARQITIGRALEGTKVVSDIQRWTRSIGGTWRGSRSPGHIIRATPARARRLNVRRSWLAGSYLSRR